METTFYSPKIKIGKATACNYFVKKAKRSSEKGGAWYFITQHVFSAVKKLINFAKQ